MDISTDGDTIVHGECMDDDDFKIAIKDRMRCCWCTKYGVRLMCMRGPSCDREPCEPVIVAPVCFSVSFRLACVGESEVTQALNFVVCCRVCALHFSLMGSLCLDASISSKHVDGIQDHGNYEDSIFQ